jgi:flavin-dependent dehydrogenase
MLDVLVAGAGPAGAMAALLLARAGARVLIIDRDEFPRDKLCGDTLNPGALALLGDQDLWRRPMPSARALAGMIVSGPGAAVEARYGPGEHGVSIPRFTFDAWLLDAAVRAGARLETSQQVVAPLTEDDGPGMPVRGLVLRRRGAASTTRLPASLVIAADGRRSVIARALGLARDPSRPRRWAFGTYAALVGGMRDVGEMHVRPWGYCGLAPMPDGSTNVCVVTGARPDGRTPLEVIRRAVARDPALAPRFERVEFDRPVRVLGPLAVDVPIPGADGVLLAGDAAGFVDPMTGDGIHLALQGAVLAAEEALRVLEHGDYALAPWRLAQARGRRIGRKLRFNRLVRAMVDRPSALHAAVWGARIAPAIVRRAVRYAGDAP